jgi:hypothetical protein
MNEWGFDCGLVTVQGGSAENEMSRPMPLDMAANAWHLSDISLTLNTMVVADGDLGPPEVSALREYVISGGWVIMPSPQEGNVSTDLEDLLRLNRSRTVTLTVLDSPLSLVLSLELGGGQLRPLVNHPSVPTLATQRWVEWPRPSGKVRYSNKDTALPLLSFLCPEVPAVRLVSLGDG